MRCRIDHAERGFGIPITWLADASHIDQMTAFGSILVPSAILPDDVGKMGLATLTVTSRMVLNGRGKDGNAKQTAQVRGMDLHLIAHMNRTSPLVESYRHLFTSLKYTQMGQPLLSVLVTSVKKGEGKSITASNLAIVAAESDQRVLLVDADLRRPTIHKIFGKPKEPGVTA
jgi:hypothetical protein